MKVLALTYWSYKEPLIHSATLPYLRAIRKTLGPKSKVYLLTLEKPELTLSDEELARVRQELSAEGIELICRPYYRFGIRAMLSWLLNLYQLRRLCRKEKISCLHAFATPIGSVAYILSRITGIPFVIDSYEPHAESMVENRSWKAGSLAHRLLFRMEKLQTRYALATLSASEQMPTYAAQKYGVMPAYNLHRPSGVNMELFQPNATPANCPGLKNKVGVYAGKLGGIYLDKEVFELFAACHRQWRGDFSALILSDASAELVTKLASEAGLPEDSLVLKRVEHNEVPSYLVLADFAVNPVKPVPSKRYCTSIKDGEYWAMGLPVIIPPDVADDSQIVQNEQAGVIWHSQDRDGCERAAEEMRSLLQREERASMQVRIRKLAATHRDLQSLGHVYHLLYAADGIVATGMKRFIVLIYNSFADPLFKNLMYRYLLTQTERHPNYRFELLTFEQRKYALTEADRKQTYLDLSASGIYWNPLAYHSGRLLILKKLYDFMLAMSWGIRVRWRGKVEMILSFANTAAAIGTLMSSLLRTKHLVYSYEPHSRFLAEFGIWSKNSLRYRLLTWLEDRAGRNSDYILTGTAYMKEDLEKSGTKAKVFRAPSGVDEQVFRFIPEARTKLRELHHWEDKVVMVYTGKFGGIYYDQELPVFFGEMKKYIPNLFLLILSPQDKGEIRQKCQHAGLSPSDYFITEAVNAEEVAQWHSAADCGITAIPPYPNQKYRSPVKVGEYLMCGLPFITCKGISEDDVWAMKHRVGVVIDEMSIDQAGPASSSLQELLAENVDELRARCRRAGVEYRGKGIVDEVLETIL